MEEKTKGKAKNKSVILIAVLAIISVLVVGVLAISYLSKRVIDLNDYLSITYEGVDGDATISYKFDSMKFVGDLTEGTFPSTFELMEMAYDVEKLVSGKFDKNDKLENGDIVKFKWEIGDLDIYEKQYKCRIIHNSIDTEIKGLEKVKKYNPFDELKVTFSGVSPNGKIQIDENGVKYGSILSFSADKKEKLKNGDKVIVSIAPGTEERQKEYGITISETEREYTVDGLDEYISSLEQIPAESMSKMEKQVEDTFFSYVAKNWSETESLKSFEHVGNYLLVAKDSTQYGVYDNCLYLIYKVDVQNSKETLTYYYYTIFYDLVQYQSGDFAVDLTNYKTPKYDKVWGTGEFFKSEGYIYIGYENQDLLFNHCVTKNLEKYTYESSLD